LQFGGRRRHALDDAADAGLELVGEIEHRIAAVLFSALFADFLFRLEPLGLDHAVLEDLDRTRHHAEFVAPRTSRNRHRGVAAGEAVHRSGNRDQRARQAAPKEQGQQHADGQDHCGAEDEVALRVRRHGLILGGVIDHFDHGDRLAGIVLDLAEIERCRMAIDPGVAPHDRAVENAFHLVLRGHRRVVVGSREFPEFVVLEAMHGDIDAEALLGAIDEFLAEGNADIDDTDTLAIAHHRRHRKDGKRGTGRLDAERLRIVDAQEDRGRRLDHVNVWHALGFQRRGDTAKQRHHRAAIALGDGVGNGRQRRDDTADRKGGTAFIVECGDDAVILKLELLIEREAGHGPLLKDREGAEHRAIRRNQDRDRQNQSGGDRAYFQHCGIS